MFLTNAARLQSHLGPILLQLPPTFHRRTPILERFLERAAEQMAKGLRLAIEFRHESWQTTEIYRLLARYHVAICIADGVKYRERASSRPTSPISGITDARRPLPTIRMLSCDMRRA